MQDFPIVRSEMQQLSKTDLLYEFNAEQQHLIEENVVRTVPSESIRDMATSQRVIENSQAKTSGMLVLTKLFFDEKDITSIITSNRERQAELHVATIDDSGKKFATLPWVNTARKTLHSFITANEQVYVKLDMHYDSIFAQRKNFVWVYNNMLPLLGKQFILFKPEDVRYYLDLFTFHGAVYIIPAGIENIMSYASLSREDFCLRYARAVDKRQVHVWCHKVFNHELGMRTGRGRIMTVEERRFRQFRTRYVNTIKLWRKPVIDEQRSELLRNKAHGLARLFAVGNFSPAVWRVLLEMAGEENIYRNALLTSRTGAFPAQEKEIKIPASLRGGAGATTPQVFADVVDAIAIVSDPLLGALEEVFYAPAGEDVISDLR